MRRFLDGMPPDSQKLLDAGCGTGAWTRRLDREGYSVTGLDISRETIEELKRLFPGDDFVVGAIRNTGLPNLRVAGFQVGLRRPIHRRHGVVRFLNRYLGMNCSRAPARSLAFALGAMLPRWLWAHIVMAVARKPARQS